MLPETNGPGPGAGVSYDAVKLNYMQSPRSHEGTLGTSTELPPCIMHTVFCYSRRDSNLCPPFLLCSLLRIRETCISDTFETARTTKMLAPTSRQGVRGTFVRAALDGKVYGPLAGTQIAIISRGNFRGFSRERILDIFIDIYCDDSWTFVESLAISRWFDVLAADYVV